MKIELSWVDHLLNRWGRWSLRIELGGLGYGHSSVFDGIDWHENEDGLSSSEPRHVTDLDIELADRAVSSLQTTFRKVVIQVHKHGQGRSDRKNAEALSMDSKTLGKYLNEAHRIIGRKVSENKA